MNVFHVTTLSPIQHSSHYVMHMTLCCNNTIENLFPINMYVLCCIYIGRAGAHEWFFAAAAAGMERSVLNGSECTDGCFTAAFK